VKTHNRTAQKAKIKKKDEQHDLTKNKGKLAFSTYTSTSQSYTVVQHDVHITCEASIV